MPSRMPPASILSIVPALWLATTLPGQSPPDGVHQLAPAGGAHLPPRAFARCTDVGDIDGDGDLDLVMGRRLFRNDGPALFTDVTAAQLPPLPQDMVPADAAFADLDGDGDLDLVLVVGWGAGRNTILLNDGTGRFADATAAPVPTARPSTFAVATGDVDGDGDVDLVFGNSSPTGVQDRLLLNDGRARFVEAPLPASSGRTFALALGDVDRDGDLDLLIGDIDPRTPIRLLVNDGRGRFTDASTSLPGSTGPTYALALGDVDGDGDLDVLVGNGGDGRAQSWLWLNDGRGRFTDAANKLPQLATRTVSVVLADLDGDTDLDAVLTDNSESARIWINQGRGDFKDGTPPALLRDGGPAWDPHVADLDRDGAPDVLIATNAGPRLFLRDRAGGYLDANDRLLPALGADTFAVAMGDIDGDGDPDLIAGNGGWVFRDQSRVHFNDGEGRFSIAPAALPDKEWQTAAIALVDVDGDRDPDLVLGTWSAPPQLLLNDGRGTFKNVTATHLPAPASPPTFAHTVMAVAHGDVDGDGDQDLFFSGHKHPTLLYLNRGNGVFTEVTPTHLPSSLDNTNALLLRDFDGDGDLDLFIGNLSEPSRLWVNDGSGRFTDASSTSLPAQTLVINAAGAADLDGDGDLDIAAGTQLGLSLLLNDGRGRFSVRSVPPSGSDPVLSVAVADLDGDGDQDIFTGSHSSLGRRDRLYLNDAGGRFTDATDRVSPCPNATYGVAAADVDGDGDADLVLGNRGPNEVLVNHLRQVRAPFLARVGHPYAIDLHVRTGFAPAGQAMALLVGARKLPRPVAIPPWGALRIDAAGLVLLPPMAIPAGTGVARLTLQLPAQPALIGVEVWTQGLALPGTGQDSWRFTNATRHRVVR